MIDFFFNWFLPIAGMAAITAFILFLSAGAFLLVRDTWRLMR